MELIKKYFPELTESQLRQFEQLSTLYGQWNEKINVISRKDMEHFYERHVLHSLAIAKFAQFEYGSTILDVGTGGGFPGIPLAIMFPNCHFTLVDSIGKKITVVKEVSSALGLKNVTAYHKRAEELKSNFDHVVSRAVTQMPKFLGWVNKKLTKTPKSAIVPHSVWYLKGGDLSEELSGIRGVKVYDIPSVFTEEFFETKKVVRVKNAGR